MFKSPRADAVARRSCPIGAKLLLALSTFAPYAACQTAATLTTLHVFSGTPDGGSPAGLVIGPLGTVYGVTSIGGMVNSTCPTGCGTVFELSPPSGLGGIWTESILYNFTGQNGDGWQPTSLFVGLNGALYGTTFHGGPANSGTVFQLTPPQSSGGPWTETILYSFTGQNGDGSLPVSISIPILNGAIYGSTQQGGAWGQGAVFELQPPSQAGGVWTETVLYSFTGGNDGARPGAVTSYRGSLLGVTYYSQTLANAGTVFELKPPAAPGGPWTETTLYSFTGGNDGGYPQAGVTVGRHGTLYGTTSSGGTANFGTVFQLTAPKTPGAPWTITVLYSFQGGNDGASPSSGLALLRNQIYGTTSSGGASVCAGGTSHGCGTAFVLTPPQAAGSPWIESVLYSFQPSHGTFPSSQLIKGFGDALFGTTAGGGNHFGQGTVFELNP